MVMRAALLSFIFLNLAKEENKKTLPILTVFGQSRDRDPALFVEKLVVVGVLRKKSQFSSCPQSFLKILRGKFTMGFVCFYNGLRKWFLCIK